MRPLYCDESIWVPVADGLRRRGWTVHTARGEDRLGDPDTEHLAYAADNDWILVTFDDDFLSLVENSNLNHAGIIYRLSRRMPRGLTPWMKPTTREPNH
jgi:predicted nuclease of predicted toxin-antitoxin system